MVIKMCHGFTSTKIYFFLCQKFTINLHMCNEEFTIHKGPTRTDIKKSNCDNDVIMFACVKLLK